MFTLFNCGGKGLNRFSFINPRHLQIDVILQCWWLIILMDANEPQNLNKQNKVDSLGKLKCLNLPLLLNSLAKLAAKILLNKFLRGSVLLECYDILQNIHASWEICEQNFIYCEKVAIWKSFRSSTIFCIKLFPFSVLSLPTSTRHFNQK